MQVEIPRAIAQLVVLLVLMASMKLLCLLFPYKLNWIIFYSRCTCAAMAMLVGVCAKM